MEIEIKQKPWGHEIWFAHTEKYAGKILHVKKGHRLSLQYHEQKMETQFVYKGKLKLTYGKWSRLKNAIPDSEQKKISNLQEKILNQGEKFDIEPLTLHRIEALEDSEIFEVSTPELDDIVKLADDYGRTGKGNNEKLDMELHKKLS